jgi:Ankyrin repeats (3 copies)
MQDPEIIDSLFKQAVAAIDSGDQPALERLLMACPSLVTQRLTAPGAWLRDKVGKALDGFFRNPYLLWFIAEDPVRNGKLPSNIAGITRTILNATNHSTPPTSTLALKEQLDYALLLVGWSWIAAECGVQIELIDTLIDAGANPDGAPDNALVNNHLAAAKHLIQRGAPMTLASALGLEYWDKVPALLQSSTDEQRQFSLILSALKGKSRAVKQLVDFGVDINTRCPDLYPHGTALHHAAVSGSLDAVITLVEGGADLNARDTIWGGTPLDWAKYGKHPAIVQYLNGKSAQS